ncbi:MAG: aldehyde dehydrogenase family protein, partial [Bacteroidota bacterium]
NAVIDDKAFKSITGYIEKARNTNDAEIIFGGTYDDKKGYFIAPTVILAHDPKFVTMQEEIFGPVLTVYVYKDDEFDKTLDLCNETSPYALTGAIFSNDRYATVKALETLRYAAGNFYINDKPTGAVVGQQPFGGSRQSGTNDKAGSYLNLLRWVSTRSIKEIFVTPVDFRYAYMKDHNCG